MFKKYLLAGLALLNMGTANIKAMEAEDSALLQRNSCPAELQELLDQAYNRDSEFRKKMNESRDAEGYFVTGCPDNLSCMIKGYNENRSNYKGNFVKPNHGKWNKSRIVELEKFNAIKAENGLKGPRFPGKCFWHVPERPADVLNDKNYFVVAEKFDVVVNNAKAAYARFPYSDFKYSDFSAQELHDLLVFMKKADWGHVHGGNLYPILHACNGKNFWENKDSKIDCSQLATPAIAIVDTKKTLQDADEGYSSLAYLAGSNGDTKASPIVKSFLKSEKIRKKWLFTKEPTIKNITISDNSMKVEIIKPKIDPFAVVIPQPEKVLKQMRKSYAASKSRTEQKMERQMAAFDPAING